MLKSLVFVAVLFGATACHNYSANVGEVLNCTLAGNGCDDGRTGEQGLTGLTGAPGTNGSSCTVQTVLASGAAPNGGARISCTDGTDALVLNGTNGIDGSDAPATPYTITQVIKPCPTVSGAHPEVLLVMANRTILASVSQSAGANTRLALITTSNYVTTDGRSCAFTVTANTVSWAGGSVTY